MKRIFLVVFWRARSVAIKSRPGKANSSALPRVYGLTEGNINHGELTLDQLYFMRPVPGWARYRTPIADLYLCGAGTHPGGGVSGAPGYNAAREILKDAKRNR